MFKTIVLATDGSEGAEKAGRSQSTSLVRTAPS